MPKTTRWILLFFVLLLILLTGYRIVTYFIFSNLFLAAKPGVLPAFLLGIAFDARIAALIIIILYTLGFWPGIHYFKDKAGKAVSIWMMGFSIAFIHFFYMADLVHLKCFHTRLNGAIIPDLAKHTARGNLFLNKVDWLAMLAMMALITWVVVFLMKKSHRWISKLRGNPPKTSRTASHIAVYIICMIALYGGFRFRPLAAESVSRNYNAEAIQLALTPLESCLGTLPGMHK